MGDNIICTRSYKDGGSNISLSITTPVENDGHALSYVIIHKDGIKTNSYKVTGIDPMHALMLAVIDCARHIYYANEDSIEGLTFLGDKDLGLPDKILNSIAD